MKRIKYQWVAHVLFAAYMCMLFKFTIFRSAFALQNFMRGGKINLNLFTEYAPFLRRHRWGHFLYLFAGNIAAFIPFGMYMGVRRIKLVPAVMYGFSLSLFVECMQYVWGVGVSELDDLILNTVGVLIGALSVKVWMRGIKQGEM